MYIVAAVEHVIQRDAPALGPGKNATAGATQRTRSAAISVFKIKNGLQLLILEILSKCKTENEYERLKENCVR
jgi:hypothetical protein